MLSLKNMNHYISSIALLELVGKKVFWYYFNLFNKSQGKRKYI